MAKGMSLNTKLKILGKYFQIVYLLSQHMLATEEAPQNVNESLKWLWHLSKEVFTMEGKDKVRC